MKKVEQKEKEQQLQRKAADTETSKTLAPPQFAPSAQTLQAKANQESPGEQAKTASSGSKTDLPEAVQTKMEGAFNADFSDVNIHQDSSQASQLGAQAFAQGNDVHFAPGRYNPESQSGQELLGHELSHVVQQRQGRVQPTMQAFGANLNNDTSLEAEADQQGRAAAKGEKASFGSAVQKKSANAAAPIQGFKMDAADQKKYPNFTSFVKTEMPKMKNDARANSNLDIHGTNTGKTKRTKSEDMAWGKGPTVNVTKLSGANGEFSPGIKSQELRLNSGIVSPYEKASATDKPAHELFLESTILHEYTHYLDDQDGKDKAGEEGQAFEEATYGMDIDSVADAKKVLKAEYGVGDWNLEVEGKEAGYKQRFIVKGAQSGDGTYDGVLGKKVSVKGPAKGKFKVTIQHNDGSSGWKDSGLLNVKESSSNYLIRSEDWSDRDRNDLTIRVKK